MSGLVLAGLIAIGLSVLGRETWGWLPRLACGAIWLHTLPLPSARRRVRREEWRAELAAEYDDRRLTGFLWAVSLWRISTWERMTTPVDLHVVARVRRVRARAIAGGSSASAAAVAHAIEGLDWQTDSEALGAMCLMIAKRYSSEDRASVAKWIADATRTDLPSAVCMFGFADYLQRKFGGNVLAAAARSLRRGRP